MGNGGNKGNTVFAASQKLYKECAKRHKNVKKKDPRVARITKYIEGGATPVFFLTADGETSLHLLAGRPTAADCELLKLLLRYTDELGLQNKDGLSPLHVAVNANNVDGVTALIAARAPLSIQSTEGHTPLDAARGMHHETVISLLEKAEHEILCEKLVGACIDDGNDDAARGYLALGADPNFEVDGLRSLDVAVRKKCGKLVSTLRSSGAVPGKALSCDLVQSCRAGALDDVTYLLRVGVVPDSRDREGRSPLVVSIEKQNTAIITALGAAGALLSANAVLLAVKTGNPDVMSSLLKELSTKGVCADKTIWSATLKASEAESLLRIMLVYFKSPAEIETLVDCMIAVEGKCLPLLLEHSYDLNFLKKRAGGTGERFTRLHGAVIDRCLATVSFLVRAAPELVFVRNWDGRTPVELAANLNLKNLANLLTKAMTEMSDRKPKIDPNEELYWACARGDACVAVWLEKGAKPDAFSPPHEYDENSDSQNGPAIERAVSNDNVNLAKILLQAGSDVTKWGKTVGMAARHKNVNMMKILLEAGADATDSHAFYVAVRSNNIELVKLLLQYGHTVDSLNFDSDQSPAMMDLLLNAGASVDNLDFSQCVRSESREKMKILLRAAQDPALFELYPFSYAFGDWATKSVPYDFLEDVLAAGVRLPERALNSAIQDNDEKLVLLILATGVDVNSSQMMDTSALEEACRKDNARLVSLLLAAGADYRQTCEPFEVREEYVEEYSMPTIVHTDTPAYPGASYNATRMEMETRTRIATRWVPKNSLVDLCRDRSWKSALREMEDIKTVHPNAQRITAARNNLERRRAAFELERATWRAQRHETALKRELVGDILKCVGSANPATVTVNNSVHVPVAVNVNTDTKRTEAQVRTSNPVNNWDAGHVSSFLDECGLGSYKSSFANVKGSLLLKLDDKSLTETFKLSNIDLIVLRDALEERSSAK